MFSPAMSLKKHLIYLCWWQRVPYNFETKFYVIFNVSVFKSISLAVSIKMFLFNFSNYKARLKFF